MEEFNGDLAQVPGNPSNVNWVAENEFTKFLSCQDLTSIISVKQADKLIECVNQKAVQISDKLEGRKLDQLVIFRRMRAQSLRWEAAYHKELLDRLQLAFDKLSFANNAYYDRPVKSSLLEDDIHFNNLHFRLRHGSNTVVEEKRLLRETKKSQKKGVTSSCSSLNELNSNIWRLIEQSYCSSIDEFRYRKIMEELQQLKCKREKAIANAAMKGEIWNCLDLMGSKQTLGDEIKKAKINLVNKLEVLRKNNLAVRTKFKAAEENLEAIQKDIGRLREELMEANRIKRRLNRRMLELRKQQNQIQYT